MGTGDQTRRKKGVQILARSKITTTANKQPHGRVVLRLRIPSTVAAEDTRIRYLKRGGFSSPVERHASPPHATRRVKCHVAASAAGITRGGGVKIGRVGTRSLSNTKWYSSTYLAMGFANVRAGTQKRREINTRVPFCIACGAGAVAQMPNFIPRVCR